MAKKSKFTKKVLVTVATEMNNVLGVDPAIDTDGSVQELTKAIEEGMDLIEAEDEEEFSKEAWGTLIEMGLEVQAEDDEEDDEDEADEPEDDEEDDEDEEEEDEKPAPKSKKKKKSEPAPEKDEMPEEDVAELPAYVDETTKMADLKTIVEEYDEFKKLRKNLDEYKGLSGTRELKAAMQEIVGKPEAKAKKKKAAKKSTVEKSRYGHRKGSFAALLDELVYNGTTEEEVIETVQTEFPDKSEENIKGRFKSHVSYLGRVRGITVEKKDGTFKAVEPSI